MTGKEYFDNCINLMKAAKDAELALYEYCLQRAMNAKQEDWKDSEHEKPPIGEAVIVLLGSGDPAKGEISIAALLDYGGSSLHWYNILEDWIYAYEDADWMPLE